jgi:hypothetical protein
MQGRDTRRRVIGIESGAICRVGRETLGGVVGDLGETVLMLCSGVQWQMWRMLVTKDEPEQHQRTIERTGRVRLGMFTKGLVSSSTITGSLRLNRHQQSGANSRSADAICLRLQMMSEEPTVVHRAYALRLPSPSSQPELVRAPLRLPLWSSPIPVLAPSIQTRPRRYLRT